MAKEFTGIRFEPDLLEAMRRVRATEGIPIAVQVDFAVRQWLTERGALKPQTWKFKSTTTKTRKRKGATRG